jgi:pyridoxine 5-phosphate synthase
MLETINEAVAYAHSRGLQVNAGHGLNRHNVRPIAANPLITELNIGHSIVADAIFIGLAQAVRDIKQLMLEARAQGS